MDPIAQAQDDLRREQMLNIATRVMPFAAAALALLILGVGGRELWHAVSDNMARGKTETLVVAAESDDSINALLANAAKDSGDRAAIARLIAYQRMSPAEQKDKGLTVLDELAADEKAPKEWRDFAALTAVRARIAFGAEASAADDLLSALAPVIADEKGAWYVAGQVQAALIEGEMKGDEAAAAKRLAPLDAGSQDEALGKQVIMLQNHYAAYAKTDAAK